MLFKHWIHSIQTRALLWPVKIKCLSLDSLNHLQLFATQVTPTLQGTLTGQCPWGGRHSKPRRESLDAGDAIMWMQIPFAGKEMLKETFLHVSPELCFWVLRCFKSMFFFLTCSSNFYTSLPLEYDHMRMGIKGTITPSACSWTPAIIAKSCFDNTRLDPHNDRNGSRSGCMYWLQIWTSFEGIFGVTPNTCVMKVCCSSAHQKSTFLAEKQKSKDTLYTVMQPRYPSTSQEVVSCNYIVHVFFLLQGTGITSVSLLGASAGPVVSSESSRTLRTKRSIQAW